MIMTNKRTLKKAINYIASELFTECVVVKSFVPGTDQTKADALMAKVLFMQHDFLARANHPEPGKVKVYYKKLREDLNAQIEAIVNEIGQLS